MTGRSEPSADVAAEGASSGRRLPRGAIVRFAVLVGLVLAAAAVLRWTPLAELVDRERLAAVLQGLRQTPWAPPILLGLWLVLSPLGVPVSPLVFAGGAVFGVGWGWIYNLIGAMLGAASSYLLARRLGHDLVSHLLGRAGLSRAEQALSRHGFWAVLRSRFIPLPFVVVNYAAAFVGMRFSTFLVASALGLTPSLLVYTYFSHAVVQVAADDRSGLVWNLVLALAAMLALTLLPWLARKLRAPLSSAPAPPPPRSRR